MQTSSGWKWLFVLLLLCAPALHAQEHDLRVKFPNITVTGEAVLHVEPDQAEIDIGVVSQAASAVEAANENAKRAARVIAEIKKIVRPADEIKTAGYSVTPNYRYPKEGGKPEIVGYTVTNIVRVRTGSLPVVGVLIDAAMRAGANRVQRLMFTLKDEDGAQRAALHQASVKAKSKAEEVARALGVKISRILSVTESAQAFRPRMAEALAARADVMGPPTPIEPGTVEIRSTVTLAAEIAAR